MTICRRRVLHRYALWLPLEPRRQRCLPGPDQRWLDRRSGVQLVPL